MKKSKIISPLTSVVLGLTLTGMLLPFANSAHASSLSTGCEDWDDNILGVRNVSDSTTSSDHIFTSGEVASVTMIDQGAGSTYTFTYTDDANGGAVITEAGGIGASSTVTKSITVPRDTTNATLNITVNSGSIHITLACTEAVAAASSGSETPATTTSAVVGAVSRSQTTVVQQNIGARASVVAGSVGASPTGGGINGGTGQGSGGNTAPGTGNGNDQDPSFTQNSHFANSTTNDSNSALRQLAMTGDFDSSQIAAFRASQNILSLGPTDQGDVGGAAGTDGRTALSSSSPITVWGHGSYTNIDNDYVSGTSDNRYDGDVWGYNVGVDYRISEKLTSGVSLGYSNTELTTTFNSGTYDEDGWVFSPYAIYTPIAGLTLVAEAGYGMGDIDVTRSSGSISGKTDSDLWYGALSASYRYRPVDDMPLSLSPSLAVLGARKTVDSYTESGGTVVGETRSNTRQAKPAVEMAYDIHQGNLTLSPFVEAGMVYDFIDELNDDAVAFNIGGGLRLSDSETGLNGSLEGNYLLGRTDYTEYTLAGTVTYGFALSDEKGHDLGIVKPFFGSNLNEYGNQRIRGGLGYSFGDLSSEMALSHIMSLADDNDQNDESAIEISLSMPF